MLKTDREEAGATAPSFTAAEEVHAQLERAVVRVCSRWSPQDRDDILQAAMVKVLELQQRSGTEKKLSFSYLCRVAYSAFIDEVRRRQRRGEVTLESEAGWTPRDRAADPERTARGSETGRAIRACVASLIASRRRAVTLHLQGHAVPEIAELLGWGVKRAENLVYRGVADLRECLRRKGITP